MVGFPRPPLNSIAEIQEYVGGARIACLECGKEMKSLNSHVQRAHSLSAAEYREKFNIPKKYPLCCPATARRRSEVARSPSNIERIRALGTEYGPITHGHAIAHELLLSRPKDWDFSWHLNEAAMNPLYLKSRPPKGMASWAAFWDARCANPELQRRWKEARSKWDHQANYQPRAEHGRFCRVVAGSAQSA